MVGDNVEQQKDSSEPNKGKRRRSAGRIIWNIAKWLFAVIFIIGLFGGGAVFGYVASIVKDEPIRSQALIQEKISENTETGFVYFNDGTLIGQLRTDEDRRLVDLKQIPQPLIDALLATEDNNFYNHIGIDFKGTTRAVLQKVLNKETQTGGSTLTQQLARRVFLNLDRTNDRKVKEIFLALRLERFLSKDEILAAYLNKVPFGSGSQGYQLHGVKAAAKGIFNIDQLDQLNIAQSAYIAGLPQLPSVYSAFNGKGEFSEKGFKRAIERQQLVLRRMLEESKITKEQYDEALRFDIKSSLAKPAANKAYNTYPYLMMEAEREAAKILVMQKDSSLTAADLSKKEYSELLEEGREHLLRGGYRIYMTIDKQIYDLMHQISSNPDHFSPDHDVKGVEQIAAVMLDHKTGAILGMIEGRDYYLEQMNFATQMLRQPGSAMKPIAAYLPALEEGLIQPGSIIDDAPIVLKNGTNGYHIPMNVNRTYEGLVTARHALNKSLNLPALKIFLEKLGIEKSWEFVKKVGIHSIQPEDYHAQTGVIGGLKYGVSVEELTNAYGTIANRGVFNDAYIIGKIVDSKGNIVYQHELKPETVVSEQTAYLMTDMLRTVVTSGTASRITSEFKNYKKIPIVGKTGTTQNYADVWFLGYSPDITLGVWAGYDQPIHTLSTDGRTRARKIWATIMNEVTDARPDLFKTASFEKPDGIVSMTVSGYSGKLPSELTRQSGRLVTDIFNKKYVPTEQEDVLVSMKYVTYNGVNYIPHPTTPDDMLREKIVVKREKPLQELMKEIEQALPRVTSKNRGSLQSYLPKDAGLDAPASEDPRIDDGATPNPPQNVRLEKLDGPVRISFTASGETDVAGYRVYRSMNGAPYQKIGTVLTGDELQLKNDISSSNQYSYYVTAVDIAGNESAPSQIVSLDGGGSPVFPDLPGLGEEGSDGGEDSDTTATSAPSTPHKPTVAANALGLSLSWKENGAGEQIKQYTIYYSESKDGTYKKLSTTTVPKFDYIGAGLSGWYRITASNSFGESSPSEAVEFKE
ncbi:Biosynthetic peptidoglycan transglycosylase [Paenibacillus sp. CECT 9249]|uniref:transglycosylase domain-containing protein n=1 Tax=Paenibacillus sp. CECT 9249 TaxID=2845385 RepID=UPI001E42B688|nr:transglycosylase domain-containing protein [Paenibacillus sp. CECT 9249]CAH0120074.1 Biosynthetic peptidoglycan transglycosylase [Paenibacillus sp. CECT 9249]